jgi:hypothetical protein
LKQKLKIKFTLKLGAAAIRGDLSSTGSCSGKIGDVIACLYLN